MTTATITPTISPKVKSAGKKTATASKKTVKTASPSAKKSPTKTFVKTSTTSATKKSAARFRKSASISPSLSGLTFRPPTYTAPRVEDIVKDSTLPKNDEVRESIGHVKAVTMQAIANKRKQERQELVKNQIEIAKKYGLNYVHVGNVTFAYTESVIAGRRRGSVIKLSTSRCHPHDSFSKGLGAAYAAKNYAEGKCIEIKSPLGNGRARNFLLAFGAILEDKLSAEDAAESAICYLTGSF